MRTGPPEREPEAKCRRSQQKQNPAKRRRPAALSPRVQSGVSQMPPRRCVVIGAGVLGASVAARLAAAGMQVTLLEADQPGRATSRWSFAWLNSNDKAPRGYHDLNHAGMKAWAELAPELDGAAWYRPVGHVELAASEAGQAELSARVERLTEWGYPARLIDAAEAIALEPALRLSWPQTGGRLVPGRGLPADRAAGRAADRLRAGPRRHRPDR